MLWVLTVAIPAGTDPIEAAQVLVDAVAGRTPTMRADIGYTPVVPAAATIDPQYLQLLTPPTATQRLATYFVRVHVKRVGDPANRGAATGSMYDAWLIAARDHFGHTDDTQLNFAPITPDQFDAGYSHASEYRTSR